MIASARAELAQALRSGLAAPLDANAAESDVELFAVATEWFFERPHDLRAGMSAVYDLLRAFYQQDPAVTSRVNARSMKTPMFDLS